MINISNKKTEEEIDNLLSKLKLKRVSEYKGLTKKHKLIDSYGYKYNSELSNLIYNNYCPKPFHKNNPYTINNIKNYIYLNNLPCELLSDIYNGQDRPLKWRCECGNEFDKDWCHFQQGQTTCLDCSNKRIQEAKYYGIDSLRKRLNEMGLLYIEGTAQNYSDGCYAFNTEGYILHVGRSALHSGAIPDTLSVYNDYSIYNINRYFEIYRDGEYKCVDNKYIGNTQLLKFKHIKCGRTFDAPWVSMRYHKNEKGKITARECPYCYKATLESYHACVLKQIFKHEYPDTITEDRSCINPLTKSVLPTDIVNHKRKIAIEVQSKFHEKEYQKYKDKIKKEYWINNNYEFYSIDIREYSVIEMIQLFFPYISEIPSYIKTSSENTDRYVLAQDLLDSGQYTYSEIAKKLNVSISSLYY